MTRLSVVPATEEHARQLALTMRQEDIEEVRASHALEPLEALLTGLSASEHTSAILDGDMVVAVFGVANVESFDTVWLLTGERVYRAPLSFIRVCQRELKRLLEQWPVLVNGIDARYSRALRWAQWLGFEVFPAIPYGVAGQPFHPIRIRRDSWDF